MAYVMHFCRNKQCNNGWIDEDLTNAKSIPPRWKYCKKCAAMRGIDYAAQTPKSNLTCEELAQREKKKEQARIMRAQAKNISSTVAIRG